MKTKKTITNDYLLYDFNTARRKSIVINDKIKLSEIFDLVSYATTMSDKNERYYIPIVYSFYDTDRHPLYVGKSIDFFNNRLAHHMKNSKWFENVVYCGLIVCDDFLTMDALEINEIYIKRPRHNKDNNRDSSFFGKVLVKNSCSIKKNIFNNIQEYVYQINDLAKFYDKKIMY